MQPHDEFALEANRFYKCALIVQASPDRSCEEQMLIGPITYLLRHSAELSLKAHIIRELFLQGDSNWSGAVFPPKQRALSSIHSIKLLLDIWIELLQYRLVCPLDGEQIDKLYRLVKQIDAFDPDSTFFRYPYSRHGNRNEKDFLRKVDEASLSSMPCSIGSIVSHEGPENFSYWHGSDSLALMEIDMFQFVAALVAYYGDIEEI